MYNHDYFTRIRYAHTDQMGFVYYGHYATFYEIGRVEALRNLGLVYKNLEEREQVFMPILESHSHYLAPLKYDEEIKIQTTIKELPKVKITFHYNIFNEANACCHYGHTVLVFLNRQTLKPRRVPSTIIRALEFYFQAN